MAVRNTIQRQIVFNTVKELGNHPTADQVYNDIFQKHPTISRGTVYRNLNILAQRCDITKVLMPDSADRFDHNIFKHYHIKCTECLEVQDVNMEYIDDINRVIEEKTGYTLNNHEIVFNGVCPTCKN